MIDSSPVTSSVSSATREFPKTTSEPGNDRKKRSATLQNSEASNSSSTHERPLAEIISEKFVPFDSVRYIVTPFEAELARDVTVDEGVRAHIFTLCLLCPRELTSFFILLDDRIYDNDSRSGTPYACMGLCTF